MEQFLKKHKLPPLTQFKVDNWNSLNMIKEVEFVVLNIITPQEKFIGLHCSIGELYQNSKN